MKGLVSVCLAVLLGCAFLAGCGSSAGTPSSSRTSTPVSNAAAIGKRTKTSGCAIRGALQDLACTPGAIFPNATRAQICRLGYARSVRKVSSSTKRQVFREYGILSHRPFEYEVDHLISLELGGSNSIANLWPEAASPTPGFHQKDTAENYLHAQVCSGAISLRQAQAQIAGNWLAVYHRMTTH